MLTCEVDAPFRTRDVWQQRTHLSRPEPDVCAARPFVFVPSLRCAACKIIMLAGKTVSVYIKHLPVTQTWSTG